MDTCEDPSKQALQILLTSLWRGEGADLPFLPLSHLERTNCKGCWERTGAAQGIACLDHQQWPALGCTHRLKKQQKKGVEVGVKVNSSHVSKVMLLPPYSKKSSTHAMATKKKEELSSRGNMVGMATNIYFCIVWPLQCIPTLTDCILL